MIIIMIIKWQTNILALSQHNLFCAVFVFKDIDMNMKPFSLTLLLNLVLVSLGGTGRDDISMQLASRDFRPCWIYAWVAVKLPP